jgi:KTSC domain
MMPEMLYVYSSHIVSIGYDSDAEQFHVRYAPDLEHPAGRVAVYHNVSPEAADDITSAPSVGSAVRAHLRDQKPFHYLD